MRLVAACAAVTVLLAAAEPIRAEPVDPSARRAQDYLKAGLARYQRGDYKGALATFKRGYQHKPETIFRYHMGRCLLGAGDAAAAAVELKAFLQEAPDAPERAEVEHLLAGGGGETAATAAPATRTAAPDGPAPTPPTAETTATAVTAAAPGAPEQAGSGRPSAGAANAPASTTDAPSSPPASEVLLALPPESVAAAPGIAAPAAPPAPEPPLPARRPVWKKWWFWLGVGGAAVVAGGAVAAGVLLGSGGDAPIPGDSTGGFHAVTF